MKIVRANRIEGDIDLPGDKSISHRAAMLAAMAGGKTVIDNFAKSADCESTLKCLEKLGIAVKHEGGKVLVQGKGLNGFSVSAGSLDCGNSGTTMRLMAGILAGQAFESTLTGDESLTKRPMKRIITPLELMGSRIGSKEGYAPLVVSGRLPLNAITYTSTVASAQIKSCVLLAGLNADGETGVISPPTKAKVASSRDHTERMLRYLGAEVSERFIEAEEGFSHAVSLEGFPRLDARPINVPSDISSAAFFLVAASCLDGSELILRNVGLNPSRIAIIDVLRDLGARIEILDRREMCNEPAGDLRVWGGFRQSVKSNIVRGDIIANLIDEIPVLAVFGTQIEGGIEIRDAEELRVKESDRIGAVAENLRRMGADVEEYPDGLLIGKSDLKGAEIEVFHDHRIAMAFAVAGLFAEGETHIKGAEWANVSFPGFFEALLSVSK